MMPWLAEHALYMGAFGRTFAGLNTLFLSFPAALPPLQPFLSLSVCLKVTVLTHMQTGGQMFSPLGPRSVTLRFFSQMFTQELPSMAA